MSATKLKDVIARPDLWFYPGEELAEDEMRVTLDSTAALFKQALAEANAPDTEGYIVKDLRAFHVVFA